MRITLAYNLRTDDTEATAELLSAEDIQRIQTAISSLHHKVTMVEVSAQPNIAVERLLESAPDLITGQKEAILNVLKQERAETLADIDRQRIDTLSYLTRERTAAIDEFKAVQLAITKLLQTEREKVLKLIEAQQKSLVIDIENAGNRMVENSLRQSKDVIDHLFIRMAQFSAAILFVGVLIVAAVKLRPKFEEPQQRKQ